MSHISPQRVLSSKEMKLIHNQSLELLAKTGLYIDHDLFLKKLHESGAVVDFKNKTVKFPQEKTDNIVKKYSGRSGEILGTLRQPKEYTCNNTPLQFNFGGTALFVHDMSTGKKREAGYADLEQLVRFGNGHPRIRTVGGPPVQMAYDQNEAPIPADLRVLSGMTYLAKHCTKPGVSEIDTREDVIYAKRLNEILDLPKTKNAYSFLNFRCTISPLKIGFETADVLYTLAELGLPIGLAPMPLAGATTPVTVASGILIANSEIIGMLTALDMISKTTQQEHIMLSGVLNMKTGGATFSSPNAVLQDIGMAQLYNYFYDIPLLATTDYIDAPTPSYQSGVERSQKIATTNSCGCLYPSIGQLGAGLICSTAQACLDIDAFDWVTHFNNGIEVSDSSLCFDLVSERGIGSHFLDSEHTVNNFKKELYIPKISGLDEYSTKTMLENAVDESEKILSQTPLFTQEPVILREIEKLYKHELKQRGY